MLRTLLFNEPNERATPGAENTAIKQRPVDVYIFDAKLINYIYIICAGGGGGVVLDKILHKCKKLW